MSEDKCGLCTIVCGGAVLACGIIFLGIVNIWSIVELANHWTLFGENCIKMRNMMLAYIILSFLGSSNSKIKDNKTKAIVLTIWYGAMSIATGILYVGSYQNQLCKSFTETTDIYWVSLSQFIITTIIAFGSLVASIILCCIS